MRKIHNHNAFDSRHLRPKRELLVKIRAINLRVSFIDAVDAFALILCKFYVPGVLCDCVSLV